MGISFSKIISTFKDYDTKYFEEKFRNGYFEVICPVGLDSAYNVNTYKVKTFSSEPHSNSSFTKEINSLKGFNNSYFIKALLAPFNDNKWLNNNDLPFFKAPVEKCYKDTYGIFKTLPLKYFKIQTAYREDKNDKTDFLDVSMSALGRADYNLNFTIEYDINEKDLIILTCKINDFIVDGHDVTYFSSTDLKKWIWYYSEETRNRIVEEVGRIICIMHLILTDIMIGLCGPKNIGCFIDNIAFNLEKIQNNLSHYTLNYILDPNTKTEDGSQPKWGETKMIDIGFEDNKNLTFASSGKFIGYSLNTEFYKDTYKDTKPDPTEIKEKYHNLVQNQLSLKLELDK